MSGPEGSSIKQVLYVHQGCFGGVRSLQKLHLKLNKATCAVFLILLRKTAFTVCVRPHPSCKENSLMTLKLYQFNGIISTQEKI